MDGNADNLFENRSKLVINAISVLVPALVIGLLAFPDKVDLGGWTKSLPHAIGLINSVTTVVLLSGFFFIKRKYITLHRIAMTIAFSLGIVFLVCYVTYHISNPSNKFSGEGIIRYLYLLILLSHILFSLVVLPLVLRAMFYAVTQQFKKHKSVVRYAYPIWLYVSVTGVIVYVLLNQIYPAK